jgi:dUTP pyrophosphatase
MKNINFFIRRTTSSKDLPLPKYMSSQAAGMDLAAIVDSVVTIEPSKFKIINTGIMIALPQGYEAQIRPRSGLASKHGITVLNSPGTIDADYRGEISIVLINLGDKDFQVNRGDRIAQLIISKVEHINFIEVDDLPETDRGCNGFGSTGL